jgi:hypothetical protein
MIYLCHFEPCPIACIGRVVLFSGSFLQPWPVAKSLFPSARRLGPGRSQSGVSRPGGSPAKVCQITFRTGYSKFCFGFSGKTGCRGCATISLFIALKFRTFFLG